MADVMRLSKFSLDVAAAQLCGQTTRIGLREKGVVALACLTLYVCG